MVDQILYSLVARGTIVLAESSAVTGNAHLVAHKILERLSQDDKRVSYSQDRHLFHILISDGITFLCMADEAMGRRLPFGFLNDIHERFISTYGHSASNAIAYEYNTTFSKHLSEQMHYWSTNPQADAIGKIKYDVNEVKNIMVQNIDKVLNRGEKIDLLVHQTDALQEESFVFRREARTVQRRFWWKNVRLACFAAVIVTVLIYILLAILCNPTMSNCF